MHSRFAERQILRRLLLGGASAQMLAPRRIGKTWLMRRLAQDLSAEGWLIAFVDVEGMRSENEFLKALCAEIEKAGDVKQRVFNHLGQRLKQLVTGDWGANPVQAIGHLDSKDFAEALIAALDAEGRNTVIMVDEIALFVIELLARDEPATASFLYHLRKLRQSYPRVRWIFTGSIGLDVVARRVGLLGSLVDLEIFPLEPFSPEEAQSFLLDACENGLLPRPFCLDDEAFSYLVRELGWLSPFYLKLVADRVYPGGPTNLKGHPLARREDIERAFETLLKPQYRTSFSTWEEHIDKNFPIDESNALHEILDVCCEEADGELFETLQGRLTISCPSLSSRALKDLLTTLSTAGYLSKDGERWRFSSGLLRRYWKEYLHP